MSRSRALNIFGLLGSLVYIVGLGVAVPLLTSRGLITTAPLALNEVGDLLAGALGPLAVFWLILGFLQQGHELQNSVDALRLQAEELKHSVEQQKAMVGITERQLLLDVEVREEQNRLAISENLPYLQVRAGGNTGFQGEVRGRRYDYLAKNIGADAQEVVCTLSQEDFNLAGADRLFTGRGEEYTFHINVPETVDFSEAASIVLTVVTRNIRGQRRTRNFLIGNFVPKMISCEPEQV